MFKYGLPNEKGLYEFVFHFKILNNILSIHFENAINPKDEERLNKVFAEKLSKDTTIYNREGGSGIAKANKILKNDMLDSSNVLDIKAINGKCITNIIINLEKLKVNETVANS